MKRTIFGGIVGMMGICLLLGTVVWSADTVNFGVCEIRSGAFKDNGDRTIWGIEAAVNEANSKGGLLGKKIELVIEDNQGKGEIGVQKAKKLVMQDNCVVVIQGSSSGVGGAIGQAMPRLKRIYLDTNAEAMDITGKNFNPYVFRTCLNAGMHVKALAHYFGKKTQYRKVFLINQDYSWGYDVAKYYEAAIKQFAPNTQVVGKEFHQVFNKDFAPYVSKITASGADYVISGNWGTDLTQLVVQSRKLGMKIPIGATFLDDDGVMNIAREAAEGCIQANMYILGIDSDKARAFEDTFHKYSGGKWPSFVIMEAYIGTKMFIEAVRKAGSFDTDKIIKAFEGMTWDGPIGPITMRPEDHQAQMPAVIAEYASKTKYYDFPYLKPIMTIPASEISVSLEESGWKPYKE
ncbi:MAG: ABC transporter substrate-binding protein [Proteobacteria bacterium]|nr:ABC transporter substrate-binding protein [Pseudomonadota bacterium]MBU2261099.1 ABC transporter substrate-binding protein [Pseudomonadota bacterium]